MPRPPAKPKPSARRSPGRPAAGQPGQRERILDAATELFSRQGVAGTPVKAIATQAGVTPALVHYYFSDRELLLDAVVEEKLQPLVAGVFAAAGDAEPMAMLIGIAGQLIRTAAATPWFPGLWIREVASAEGALRERVLDRFALQRAGALSAPLAAAIARGQLNSGLEPALVMPSLIGLTLLPLATTHIWRRLPGGEAVDTDTLVRHVSALLTHGLAPAPDAGKSRLSPESS